MDGYVQVDGQWLAPAVARDLARMAAKFKADNGFDLFCSSGARTRQVQMDLWNAWQRHLAGGPYAPRAAHPDDPKAYHYIGNPTGPRAVDVRDSGDDPGVTRRGTLRDKWMEAHAHEFNFENEGYLYDEAWHKVWRGGDPFAVTAGGGALGLTQRQVLPGVQANGRAEPSSKSALAGDPLNALTVGNFTGWINGEDVQGNRVWFRGTSGRWFWSGAFEGGPKTAGLEDLNTAAVAGNQRVAGPGGVNARSGPSSSSRLLLDKSLAAGVVGTFDGWVNGESIAGIGVWFRGAFSGAFFWAGGFIDQGTHDLADLNVTPPPPPPNLNPAVPFTPAGAQPRGAWTDKLLGDEARYPVAKSERTGFVVHWDGGRNATDSEDAKLLLRAYEQHHRTADAAGGLKYNLAVDPISGDVFVGRGLENRGMHSYKANTPLIGVILIGGPGNLTDAGKRGLRKAYRIAADYVGRELTPTVHALVPENSTTCPGPELTAWVLSGALTAPDVPPPTQLDPAVRTKLQEFADWLKKVLGG
jgi:hypothetical protein